MLSMLVNRDKANFKCLSFIDPLLVPDGFFLQKIPLRKSKNKPLEGKITNCTHERGLISRTIAIQ